MTGGVLAVAVVAGALPVSVLSFERPEDASRVFMMASMDPVTYQVVSLDPPPEARRPTRTGDD